MQWFAAPQAAVAGHVVTQLDDQCLTFDKWRLLCLVDDEYNVAGAVETYF